MIEDREYMGLIYGWVERGCSLFIAAHFTNMFHEWVHVSANLLSSGYICICVNVCFNASKMINTSCSFIDENVAYETVYTDNLF